jgi:TatD DNase family protein
MTETLIDTHAHLTAKGLSEHIDDVVSRAKDSGVGAIICVGTDPQDCRAVKELARRYTCVFAAGGIHPHEANKHSDIAELRGAVGGEKWLAIGETGLDFHYDFADRQKQRNLFEQQLALAGELDLPVIVHCREAVGEALAMIRAADRELRGVFHCFTGTPEEARRVVDLGWYISFGGIVTFKKSDELRRIAADMPIDQILIETDSPYLSPEPVRHRRPNEPAHVRYVAEAMVEVRRVTREKLLAQLWSNAVRLFGSAIGTFSKGAIG